MARGSDLRAAMWSCRYSLPSIDEQTEALIREWRVEVGDEQLERGLRQHLAELDRAGLDHDEAFLIAARRSGTLDAAMSVISRASQPQAPAVPQGAGGLLRRLGLQRAADNAEIRREFQVMAILACAAAVAARAPEALGIENIIDPFAFYARNTTLLVLPTLAGYFAWKRQVNRSVWMMLAGAFLAVAVFGNIYPFDDTGDPSSNDLSDTAVLAALHLPILTWMLVGVAHAGGHWRDHAKRMSFVRFTGEWILYYGLIAVAGQIFAGTAALLFFAVDIDMSTLLFEWMLPCGAAGAAVVAAWLADTRGGVLARMAPVATGILTPLLAMALLGFVAVATVSGRVSGLDRELLISFDAVLALVLALVIYSTAVRDPHKPPQIFDLAQLVLIAAALLADILLLGAVVGRLSDFGATPNRIAALGENLVLLGNLAWSARLSFGFWMGRTTFQSVERWQTAYAPVYALWAAAVVVVFPPVFGFA